jgi:hypothetical protein
MVLVGLSFEVEEEIRSAGIERLFQRSTASLADRVRRARDKTFHSQPSTGFDPLFLRGPVDDDLILIRGFQRNVDRLRLFRGEVELLYGLVHVGCANEHLGMARRDLHVQGRWSHDPSVNPCLGMIRHRVHGNLRRVCAGMALKKLPVCLRC